MEISSLKAVSPVDGRYHKVTQKTASEFFFEFSFLRIGRIHRPVEAVG